MLGQSLSLLPCIRSSSPATKLWFPFWTHLVKAEATVTHLLLVLSILALSPWLLPAHPWLGP